MPKCFLMIKCTDLSSKFEDMKFNRITVARGTTCGSNKDPDGNDKRRIDDEVIQNEPKCLKSQLDKKQPELRQRFGGKIVTKNSCQQEQQTDRRRYLGADAKVMTGLRKTRDIKLVLRKKVNR